MPSHPTAPIAPRRRLAAAAWLAAAALLLASPPAAAASRVGQIANDAWLGLAAATCSVVYAPVKVFVSGSGVIVGGAAWAVTGGQSEPALTILERTVGGDWLITQEHLRGQREFSLLGPTRTAGVAHRVIRPPDR